MSGLIQTVVAVFMLQTSLLNLSGIDIIQELAVPPEAVCAIFPLYCTLCEGVYWIEAITTNLLTLRLECNSVCT